MAFLDMDRKDILRSTLFHIQMKHLQYIDNFPERVTDTFIKLWEEGLEDYNEMKRRLYGIKSSFFRINKDKTSKREFFLGLYNRLQRIAG